jgi:acylphosphatase
MMMKRMHVYVTGRVQGVFFRAETERTAKSLNLTGWVRNVEDGGVEAVFEGEDHPINQMIAWCYKGPPASRVDHVEFIEEPYTGSFRTFRISYS